MEEFDYSAMLTKLMSDKQDMIVRLKAIDMAIEAISQLTSGEYNNLVDLSAKSVSTPQTKKSAYEEFEMEVVDEYHPDMAPVEKLIYAIFKKNGSFAQEAAEYIYGIDESDSLEYLKTRFTDIASGLGRAKKLNIKKIGKKYKYSIPQEVLNKYYESIL